MDGVEGPVAVSPVGGKGLDPEGLGEIGEGEVGVGGDRRGRKAPVECCSRRDIKCQLITPEHASYSKDERNDVLHDRVLHSFKKEGSDKYNHLGESEGFHMSPECKKMQRKSIKRLNSSPCPKRPRTDQIENNTSSYITKCMTHDKSRLQKDLKNKVVQDGKRCERKNCRAIGKAKPDSFMWKNGSSSYDHFAGGNNIFGIHGIKLDFHDCTKDMDEPSLTELLDGSYDCPSLCQSKGKKVSSVNENIALTIWKACSILTMQGPTYSGNKEVLVNAQSSNNSSTMVAENSDGDKVTGESMPFSKTSSDHNMVILSQSQLHHPRCILERLALPTGQDLSSLFRDLNLTSSDSSHSTSATSNVCDTGLPPFSWSSNGSCRPSADTGKLAMNRHPGQGRWVRIGSHCSINGESPGCFPELVHKTVDLKVVPSMQKELDELFQDAKTLTMSYSIPLQQCVGLSCEVADNPKTNLLENDKHRKVSTAFKICNCFDPSCSNSRDKSFESCFSCEMKELTPKGKEAEGSLWNYKTGEQAVDLSSTTFAVRDGGVIDQDDVTREMHGHLKKSVHSPCRSGKDGCSLHSWHLSTTEISKAGHSPRVLAAAEILWEMSRYSEANRKQNQTNEKIRWPILTAQMAMKARQPKPPLVKMEELPQEAKTSVPQKSIKVSSPQHKSILSDKKSKLLCTKNASRESLRWPSTVETLYTPKLDRDPPAYTKPSFINSTKHVDLIMPPPRGEKGRDDHYKCRKEMTALPSYPKPFGVKEWNRGRSRRE